MTMTTASLLARAHDGGGGRARPGRSASAAFVHRRVQGADPRRVRRAAGAARSERGALLRREGLYTSHIAEWRKARDAGAREGLAPKAEGAPLARAGRAGAAAPPATSGSRPSWRRPRLALEITGKAHALLEQLSESADVRHEVEAVIAEHFDDLEAVDVDQAACGLLGASRATRLPAPAAAGGGPAGTAAGAAERADRGRAPARPGGAALGGVLRPGARPGVGPAAR